MCDAVVEDHPVGGAEDPVLAAADAELGEVARVEAVEELGGVGPLDVDLAERRGVHHADALARGAALAQRRRRPCPRRRAGSTRAASTARRPRRPRRARRATAWIGGRAHRVGERAAVAAREEGEARPGRAGGRCVVGAERRHRPCRAARRGRRASRRRRCGPGRSPVPIVVKRLTCSGERRPGADRACGGRRPWRRAGGRRSARPSPRRPPARPRRARAAGGPRARRRRHVAVGPGREAGAIRGRRARGGALGDAGAGSRVPFAAPTTAQRRARRSGTKAARAVVPAQRALGLRSTARATGFQPPDDQQQVAGDAAHGAVRAEPRRGQRRRRPRVPHTTAPSRGVDDRGDLDAGRASAGRGRVPAVVGR